MIWSIGMSMKSPRISLIGALCLNTTGLIACGGTPPPPPDSALVADPPPSDGGAPGEGVGELDRGIAYIEQGAWEEAQDHFKKAIEKMPGQGEPRYYLALTHLQLGDAAAAEDGFKKAIELDPKLYLARAQLGALYANGETPRCTEALEVLVPALESIPATDEDKTLKADSEGIAGYCYWQTKDYAASQKHYEASLAAEDLPNTRLALGSMLMEADKPKVAVPHFEAYAESLGDDPKQLAQMGRTFSKAGAPGKCIEMLDRAVELDADAKMPLLMRGQCKIQNDDLKGAREDFLKAIEKDNRFQEAYFYMGVAWLESKNRLKSAEAFQQVVRIDKKTKVGQAAQKRLEEIAKRR